MTKKRQEKEEMFDVGQAHNLAILYEQRVGPIGDVISKIDQESLHSFARARARCDVVADIQNRTGMSYTESLMAERSGATADRILNGSCNNFFSGGVSIIYEAMGTNHLREMLAQVINHNQRQQRDLFVCEALKAINAGEVSNWKLARLTNVAMNLSCEWRMEEECLSDKEYLGELILSIDGELRSKNCLLWTWIFPEYTKYPGTLVNFVIKEGLQHVIQDIAFIFGISEQPTRGSILGIQHDKLHALIDALGHVNDWEHRLTILKCLVDVVRDSLYSNPSFSHLPNKGPTMAYK